MDLLCPHCTRRITVPDDKAGLVLACPLCAKQFMAPSLPPAAPPAPVVSTNSPPAGTYGVSPPPPAPAPVMPASAPASQPIEPAAPVKPPPPLPPGEYRRTCTLYLRSDWLAFVPVACLALIFFLSFFSWHVPDANTSVGLWGLAFTEKNAEPRFLIYFLVMVICTFLAVMSLLFELQLIFVPPQMDAVKPLLMYKDLFVALVLGIALLLLVFDYVDAHLLQALNPIGVGLKLAIRVHFVAWLASMLLFWLHWRKTTNAPPPKCELRW